MRPREKSSEGDDEVPNRRPLTAERSSEAAGAPGGRARRGPKPRGSLVFLAPRPRSFGSGRAAPGLGLGGQADRSTPRSRERAPPPGGGEALSGLERGTRGLYPLGAQGGTALPAGSKSSTTRGGRSRDRSGAAPGESKSPPLPAFAGLAGGQSPSWPQPAWPRCLFAESHSRVEGEEESGEGPPIPAGTALGLGRAFAALLQILRLLCRCVCERVVVGSFPTWKMLGPSPPSETPPCPARHLKI